MEKRKTERLDKILSHMGVGTRKEVKKILKKGVVTVDGKVEKDPKKQIDPYLQEICIEGERWFYRKFIYLMMHKPPGVISATEDIREKTVVDLLAPEDAHLKPFPVGRLDKDTEGLLLLTNDGTLAHRLLSPKRHVPKTYFARVQGKVTEADRHVLEEGVVLEDGYKTLPAKVTILQQGEISEVKITIVEGKFHQIKRMFSSIGKKVLYLKRLSMGPIFLDSDLPIGAYRELTDKELEQLTIAVIGKTSRRTANDKGE